MVKCKECLNNNWEKIMEINESVFVGTTAIRVLYQCRKCKRMICSTERDMDMQYGQV